MEINSVRIRYQFDGPTDRPVVVFSNSLGADLSMWNPQITALTAKFRTLRYDTRGQGLSALGTTPYTIAGLSRDVIALLDTLEIRRAHFCGISMGGMIGLWLGIHSPERLDKLLLCNTAARIGTLEMWNGRIAKVNEGGVESIADASLERWFTNAFRMNSPEVVKSARQMMVQSPVEGFIACCEALRDANLTEDVSRVAVPTMVISGSHDPATPPAEGRFLAEKIKQARYVELEAAHLSNIEAAQQFSNSILEFLGQ